MKISFQFVELWSYLKQIVKKWYFILLIVLDLLAVTVQYFVPKFTLPSFLYVLIIIISFFIAGFDIFRENQKKYFETVSNYEKNIKQLLKDSYETPDQFLLEEINPNLLIEFIEGSEYSFSPRETNNLNYDEDLPFLPLVKIRLNLRVTNNGNTELQILGIASNLYSYNCFENYPISAGTERIITGLDSEVKYPIIMHPTKTLLCTIESKIYFNHITSDLLLAASLREIITKSNFEKVVNVLFKAIYPKDSSLHEFNVNLNFSTRHFFDYLLNFWEEKSRNDLVRIAKGK
jgi:hypothetical protein